jgi:hypothetical protein
LADSARWEGFEFRPGDVVITTPPKSGTTWTQVLCALLIFDGPEFPQPINRLSPWLDQCTRPISEVHATYAAQRQRRIIKSHTPLDGIPTVDGVTYVVVGRDPRDVMISMEHHLFNTDLDRVRRLCSGVVGLDGLGDVPIGDDPDERFRDFVANPATARGPTLSGVLHHLDTAWHRRHDPGVVLFHYADYLADLPGEVQRLADALGIEISAAHAERLAQEASLEKMRERASDVTPSADLDIWKDPRAFFRAGTVGQWRDRLGAEDLAVYDEAVATLVDRPLAGWAHQGRLGSGIDPG